jgi:hypothetical protein
MLCVRLFIGYQSARIVFYELRMLRTGLGSFKRFKFCPLYGFHTNHDAAIVKISTIFKSPERTLPATRPYSDRLWLKVEVLRSTQQGPSHGEPKGTAGIAIANLNSDSKSKGGDSHAYW